MDFISTALVTLKQPTGMWVKILNAFKGAGSYIVSVILIAIILRVIFSVVDIVNKKVNMKSMKLNEKMRPELEAIQKKYGNDQKVMQMKQNEIYKKYQFSMMGTCLPMLITMVLQFVVFLTLWNSLQSVANYNIVEKYENMKDVYVSVVELNDESVYGNLQQNIQEAIDGGKNYELKISVDKKATKMTITLSVENEGNVVFENLPIKKNNGLKETYELLQKYVLEPKQEESPEEDVEQNGVIAFENESEVTPVEPIEYIDTGFNKIFKTLAEQAAEQYYLDTQEGFLWIKNYYKADSPSSPLFTKKEIKNYLSKYYSAEEKALQKEKDSDGNLIDYEGQIFDCVVTAGIGQKKLGNNGYYILTIIAVIVSVFSMWLSNFLMKDKNAAKPQKKSWAMYVIMPLIFGIFTFMYTSLFAVYIITGQLVMIVFTPLTTWIVKKWLAYDENKKASKDTIVVDYRRDDVQNTRKMVSPQEKKEQVIEVDYRRRNNPGQFSSVNKQSKKKKK